MHAITRKPIDIAKLYGLEVEREQAFAHAQGTWTAIVELSQAIRLASADLRPSNLWKPSDGTAVLLNPALADKLPAESRIASRIEAMKQRRASLMAASKEAEPALSALDRLTTACMRYADEHAAAEADSDLAEPLPEVGMSDLDAGRSEIAALQVAIAKLEAATYGQDEARADLEACIYRAADEGAARLGRMVANGEAVAVMKVRALHPEGYLDLMPLFAAILGPDSLLAALSPYVESMPPSIPAGDRAATLTRLRAQLTALEVAEESEVLRRRALGQQTARRGDASPAVVLALRD